MGVDSPQRALVSIGDWLGEPVPVTRGLLSVASAMAVTDLRASGRTLENLGLAGCDRPALRRLLAEGLDVDRQC